MEIEQWFNCQNEKIHNAVQCLSVMWFSAFWFKDAYILFDFSVSMFYLNWAVHGLFLVALQVQFVLRMSFKREGKLRTFWPSMFSLSV